VSEEVIRGGTFALCGIFNVSNLGETRTASSEVPIRMQVDNPCILVLGCTPDGDDLQVSVDSILFGLVWLDAYTHHSKTSHHFVLTYSKLGQVIFSHTQMIRGPSLIINPMFMGTPSIPSAFQQPAAPAESGNPAPRKIRMF